MYGPNRELVPEILGLALPRSAPRGLRLLRCGPPIVARRRDREAFGGGRGPARLRRGVAGAGRLRSGDGRVRVEGGTVSAVDPFEIPASWKTEDKPLFVSAQQPGLSR